MTSYEEAKFMLEDRLEELTAGVINRASIDLPELKARLQPPRLRVVKGPQGLNSYCVPKLDGTKIILIGADLYSFIHHYTRAAATYFLPSKPDGTRPSSFWPNACAAVATTLDWISSPTPVPLYPEFDLTPHQAHIAHAFAAYTYRFVLCHEIAHVALGHVDENPTEPRRVGNEDIEVLRTSQSQELAADQLGLHLQIKSLPDSTQLVTGLASAIYFVHITGLLDARLMLSSHLVDYQKWKIKYTHPPTLQRVFNLMTAAKALHDGWESGLETVHYSLGNLDGELYDVANKQQEAVMAKTLNIVNEEVMRYSKLYPSRTRLEWASDNELRVSSNPPNITEVLLQLFDQSPLGVLRALEPPLIETTGDIRAKEDQIRSYVTERLALALSPECQRFRHQTRVQRAEEWA